ncbi:MAG TPA: PDZ domain-containing protein, partial [Pyrinomonadaceae bacterium]|nr:PDZ domain-containing protein [Pyrinomonadaceae bacterium]
VKIDSPKELPTVKLGNSEDVQVGDWVLAIGSPFGLDQTVTAGIISKKERQAAPFTSFQQFLQTDAAINRGNSGGPLVNMRGEVIGINSQIATSTGDYNGIGFALPSNEASFVYQQIIVAGKVRRGYLGIFLDSVRPEFARVYELPDTKGAIVTDVRDQQGPAGKAGIQANDVIVEFNGQPVQSAQDLINRVAGTPVGQAIPLAYLRDVNGKLEKRNTTVTIGERPSSLAPKDDDAPLAQPKDKALPESNRVKLGVTLQEMTPQVAAERKLTGVRGLYVKDIDPNGIIADARPRSLLEGDVILRINRTPVASLEEFEKVVAGLKPGDAVVLNVARYDPDAGRILQRVVQFTYQ